MSPFAEHKILGHLPVLNNYLGGADFYAPIQVEIDVTNSCTSDCPWCAGFLNRKWSKAELPAELVHRLIDELAGMGVKSMTWTGGGDPTCHRNWLDFLRHAKERGLENGLITNGVIDVQEAAPLCLWIRFSVDAATEATYGAQHGRPHHFSRVLENVRKAANVKDGCTIGVAMVTGDGTRDEIVDFARLWNEVPVDYIQYRPLLDTHGQAWFSDSQATIDMIRRAADEDSRVQWSEPKYAAMVRGEDGRTKQCHGVFVETAIAADGKVYVCCHLKGRPEYAIGDLHVDSFDAIWRRHLENRRFDVTADCPSFCRHLGTNLFVEREVLAERMHVNFI